MSTVGQERRRPKLEVAMEQAVTLTAQLEHTTRQYQQLKYLLEGDDLPTNTVGLLLVVGEHQVPVALPEDEATRIRYVEEAVGFLGHQVVQLWQQLHRVVSEAASHCDAALAAQRQQATES